MLFNHYFSTLKEPTDGGKEGFNCLAMDGHRGLHFDDAHCSDNKFGAICQPFDEQEPS